MLWKMGGRRKSGNGRAGNSRGPYHYRVEDGCSPTRFGLEVGHARSRGFRIVTEVFEGLITEPLPPLRARQEMFTFVEVSFRQVKVLLR